GIVDIPTLSIKSSVSLYRLMFWDIKELESPNRMVWAKLSDLRGIIPMEDLIFKVNNSTILPDSYYELDRLVSLMEANPKLVIQVETHANFAGDSKKNLELADARAIAIKDYLVAKGIDGRRIKSKAFGG